MPSIQMPTISVYPQEGTSGVGKAGSVVLPLALGETLEAVVEAKTGTSRYELTIKNGSVSAYSELPLAKGERLTVRVEQLKPQVVLGIVHNGDTASAIMSRYASFNRANPEALRDIFLLGKDMFSQSSLLETLPENARKILAKAAAVFDALMMAPTSTKDQAFLKNYLTNLGMFLEFDLRQVVEGKKDVKLLKQDSLKGLLQKLTVELKSAQVREGHPENLPTIAKLLEFTEKAVKTIEGQQILNTQPAISGRGFFQIPVILPNDVRMADLFINTEEDRGKDSGGKKYHVAMFLNLDALGEMMVDASLTANRLRCVFKFEEHGTREFMAGFVGDLEKKIREIGFGDVFLQCVYSDSIGSAKMDSYQDLFFGREAVNVFA